MLSDFQESTCVFSKVIYKFMRLYTYVFHYYNIHNNYMTICHYTGIYRKGRLNLI